MPEFEDSDDEGGDSWADRSDGIPTPMVRKEETPSSTMETPPVIREIISPVVMAGDMANRLNASRINLANQVNELLAKVGNVPEAKEIVHLLNEMNTLTISLMQMNCAIAPVYFNI